MNKEYPIDRFEDNGWVVLEREDGLTFNVPQEWVPKGANEGDVLSLDAIIELNTSCLNLVLKAET